MLGAACLERERTKNTSSYYANGWGTRPPERRQAGGPLRTSEVKVELQRGAQVSKKKKVYLMGKHMHKYSEYKCKVEGTKGLSK